MVTINATLRRGIHVLTLCMGVIASTMLFVPSASAGAISAPPHESMDALAARGPFTYATAVDDQRCLDVQGRTGPAVQVYRCHSGDNQQWYHDQIWENQYRITLRSAVQIGAKCVDGHRGKAVQVETRDCQNISSQQWIPHTQDGISFSFENYGLRGQCLDVRDWGRSEVVQLWDCHGGHNQLWR